MTLTLFRSGHYYARVFSINLNMPIYDVSVALSSDTPTYPGDPAIEISQFLSLAAGDAANVSLIHFGAHSGTHVDASFRAKGTTGNDGFPCAVNPSDAYSSEKRAKMVADDVGDCHIGRLACGARMERRIGQRGGQFSRLWSVRDVLRGAQILRGC